ncbi:MAG: hypothetical protein EBZ58_07920 [Bacteroidetes bacterium]|nr:hypothetical protein [Bacteroidota bacterium]
MKLEARNKRLVLDLVKQEKEEANTEFVLVSKKAMRPDNNVYRVVDRSDDCTVSVHIGALVVVEGNMVEETKVGDSTFLTCKENFVIGLLKD